MSDGALSDYEVDAAAVVNVTDRRLAASSDEAESHSELNIESAIRKGINRQLRSMEVDVDVDVQSVDEVGDE